MPEGWVSPTGFVDPSNDWADETYAYDDNVVSYARGLTKKYNDWSTWLELTLGAPILCNKIRVHPDDFKRDIVQVDVYYDGGWHQVLSAAITGTWIESAEFEAKMVSAARTRTHSTAEGQYGQCEEFDFWETVPATGKPPGLQMPMIGGV